MVRLVVALFVLAACKHASPEETHDRCLALPAAVRATLTASPDGSALYWLERAPVFDFDANVVSAWRLVRHDLHTRRTDVVFEQATSPINFIGGQLLAIRQRDNVYRAVLLASDGHVQELTPEYLDVVDIEVIDSHSFAFLADGDGARAVYTLDLAELRPYHLIDADVLLSAAGGRVFARIDDEIVGVDLKTREPSRMPNIRKSQPVGDRLIYVDSGAVIAHEMTSNAQQTIVTTERPWKLQYQRESVLARTRPVDDKSYAALITGSRVTTLPTVLGGASIVGATAVGSATWALIGHNTANYLGDLAETDAEADICLLPSASEVTYPTRNVPARFVERSRALFEAVEAKYPKATMQIAESAGEPTTLAVELKTENGGNDVGAMRARTREAYDLLTRNLNDPEIRTELVFADARHGLHRWMRERLRPHTAVGMGDALVSDRADFELEVANLDNHKRDGKITCAGTLRNLQEKPTGKLDIKCSGNREHLIHFEPLQPDEARAFSQTFEVSDNGESAYFDVLLAGKPLDVRNADFNETNAKVFSLAADVYADTGLFLDTHSAQRDTISVHLKVDPSFMQRDTAAQDAAITKAYERYGALREIYALDGKTPLSIHVVVQVTDESFDYDGSLLTRN